MKIRKRISAIILTLALVLTMMPAMAFTVFADDDAAFGIAINGKAVSVTVTKQQLKANAVGPQVFPFAAEQGNKWKYVVADGASYESVLTDALGIDSLDKIGSASINWNNESDAVQGKFDLNISDLPTLVKVFKLIDQNGDEITGAFNGDTITSAQAVALDGAADVTPIIAYKYTMYDSYAAAAAAAADGSWEVGAAEEVRPFVGGDLSRETFLKKDGSVKMGVINFTGKFSIVASNSGYKLNVKNYVINLPSQPETGSITMTVGDSAKKLSSSVYTDVELDYLGAVWECDDTSVVKVDSDGTITPLEEGAAKVSLVAYEEGTTNVQGTIGEWTVTVKAKAAPVVVTPVKPAKPAKFKVKNVKKKTAVLTWAKSKNAKGYEVWRSTKKNKGFKKIKTLKKLKFKNTKLKKGKTYYYKVRAYTTKNGKKVYSKFSTVKKVKIKK